MPFNWQTHLKETAQWLLEMSEIPGFVDHARYRRDKLLANPMYGEALRQEIRRQREAAEALKVKK